MHDFYKVLDNSEELIFDDVLKYLYTFIDKCVQREKKERWKFLAKSHEKLFKKFNGLWGSIETTKSIKYMTIDELNLKDNYYVYYCMHDCGYLIKNKDLIVCEDRDGFLFSKDSREMVFLTHESEYYKFIING